MDWWAGAWETARRILMDFVRWLGRGLVGGMRGIRIVPDPLRATWSSYESPSGDGNALMCLGACLHITNSSKRTIRFLPGAQLLKTGEYGTLEPKRPAAVTSWNEFEASGDLAPESKGEFVCQFFVPIERSKYGGYVVQPWEFHSRIRLIDQYGRHFRTKKKLHWCR